MYRNTTVTTCLKEKGMWSTLSNAYYASTTNIDINAINYMKMNYLLQPKHTKITNNYNSLLGIFFQSTDYVVVHREVIVAQPVRQVPVVTQEARDPPDD